MCRLDLVRILVEQGRVQVDMLNDNGMSAAALAATQRSGTDVVMWLLREKGADARRAAEAALCASPPNTELLVSLIDSGVCPVTAVMPRHGASMLTLAASLRSLELMRLCLDKGAAVDGVELSVTKETPLTMCLRHEFVDGVRLVLERGAGIRKPNSAGLHPVYIVCGSRSLAAAAATATAAATTTTVVVAAVGSPVAPHAGTPAGHGGTPVGLAGTPVGHSGTPSLSTTDALPRLGACDDESDAVAVQLLELLVASGATVCPIPSPAVACAKSGRVRIFEAWLRLRGEAGGGGGGDGSLRGDMHAGPAVAEAVQLGHWPLVVRLVQAGAPLQDQRRLAAVNTALRAGAPADVLHALLRRGDAADALGDVALTAINLKRVDVLEVALDCGFSANAVVVSQRGASPLQCALVAASFECAAALLRAGAVVPADCDYLALAAKRAVASDAFVDVIAGLLDAGASPAVPLSASSPLLHLHLASLSHSPADATASPAAQRSSGSGTGGAASSPVQSTTPGGVGGAASAAAEGVLARQLAGGSRTVLPLLCTLPQPIHPFAARAARAVLASGASVHASPPPLALAAESGHLELVRMLIRAAADVHEASESGDTPLGAALRCGHVAVCAALLSVGADVATASPAEARAILADACALPPTPESRAVVDRVLLLATDAQMARVGGAADALEPCIVAAASRGNTALLQRLLTLHNAPSAARGGVSAVCAAVSSGSVDALKLLLDRGASADAAADPSGATRSAELHTFVPLVCAAARADAVAVKLLLQAGARVERYGGDALVCACRSRCAQVARMLLGAGVKAEAVASDGTHECALHLVADVR